MQRVKLTSRKKAVLLSPEARTIAALRRELEEAREDLLAEQKSNRKAFEAVETLKHEIIDIQQGYYRLTQKVRDEASAKTRKRVEGESAFRIKELEVENEKFRKLATKAGAGEEVACPECGSLFVPFKYEPR